MQIYRILQIPTTTAIAFSVVVDVMSWQLDNSKAFSRSFYEVSQKVPGTEYAHDRFTNTF